jgi:hypothetical protein
MIFLAGYTGFAASAATVSAFLFQMGYAQFAAGGRQRAGVARSPADAPMEDCCDRKIIALRAWAARGLQTESARDMMIEAVEARFGKASIGLAKLEFLQRQDSQYPASPAKIIDADWPS